jgi:hypothetical protein
MRPEWDAIDKAGSRAIIAFGVFLGIVMLFQFTDARRAEMSDPTDEVAETSAAQVPLFDEAGAISVSAVELQSAFDANEIAASEKFGNASLILTGWVKSIQQERFGADMKPVARLNTGGDSFDLEAVIPYDVAAKLQPEDELELKCVGVFKQVSVVADLCDDVRIVRRPE